MYIYLALYLSTTYRGWQGGSNRTLLKRSIPPRARWIECAGGDVPRSVRRYPKWCGAWSGGRELVCLAWRTDGYWRGANVFLLFDAPPDGGCGVPWYVGRGSEARCSTLEAHFASVRNGKFPTEVLPVEI